MSRYTISDASECDPDTSIYKRLMKIGLISDTHIATSEESLPEQLRGIFKGTDLILHAGDVYDLSVLDRLQEIAPVKAVRGNGDPWSLTQDSRVDETIVMDILGLRLGLTHGLDYPPPPWRSVEAAMEYEFGGRVDIFVFGDTHVPVAEAHNGILMVNPGSPTLPHGIKEPGTVALLEIFDAHKLSVQIIPLSDNQRSTTFLYAFA